MSKNRLLFLTILFFTVSSGLAQDTLWFDIKSRLVYLGELQVVQKMANYNSYYYLTAQVPFLRKYVVEYHMETAFKANVLINSLAYIKVNKRFYHYCQIQRTQMGYIIKKLNKPDLYYQKDITTGITRLYFNAETLPDTIFSEFDGSPKPLVKKDAQTFVLTNGDRPMEFVFDNGHVLKVIVPNNIMDFFIVLRQ
ncbi:MAG: hypothetical protein CVU09_05985 [Bacteroidetes bacterium HGW-Bacteroidetes-4]|jgi:hypothetical protein|nr:MAG: hypothetical protein CVU09_05985 [Bacteroidetes bacterium HGW-Bacteroidetes-4]